MKFYIPTYDLIKNLIIETPDLNLHKKLWSRPQKLTHDIPEPNICTLHKTKRQVVLTSMKADLRSS